MSAGVPAAIYYNPEAYSTSGPKVMGRNSAGESFLRGFVAHGAAREFWALVDAPAHGRHFQQALRALGRMEPVRIVERKSLHELGGPGTVYYPAPAIGPLAQQRAAFGHDAWSLCGITHTTSSAGAMDALCELLLAPVQPWDAVICTSQAARANVMRLLEGQVEYLKERLGATRVVLPQLPVIPLGINTADFACTDAQRAAARARLGVDADTLVVLFLGRLSFHAKAHPLPMYQALELAVQATGKRAVLVECGSHASEAIRKAFAEAAQFACPSLRVVTLDSHDAENRRDAWAGADIFTSLSDNIQESFGLTPVEAMAAGLPLVVSDWNGYKDSVRDGTDGFRVPTLLPPPGAGADLALRHALEIDTYDRYCGYTSITTAVDVEAAAKAFGVLFTDPALRHRMGAAGRERARACYDWSVVMPRYLELWDQLREMRSAAPKAARTQRWAARPDPFHAYAGHATRVLLPQSRLRLVDADADSALRHALACRDLMMVSFARDQLPNSAELAAIIGAAARGEVSASELLQDCRAERRRLLFRGLAWLVKINVLAMPDA